MIFRWLRNRRRQRILAQPMPEAWVGWIERNVNLYERLPGPLQKRLLDDVAVFVAEKRFEAGQGFEVTDEVKVTIAAQACIMLGFDPADGVFPKVDVVVVNAQNYDAVSVGGGAMQRTRVLGHTDAHGPVFLSWASVRHGGYNPADGRNLVYHEFAHKLDVEDGLFDGTPPLAERALKTWVEVMSVAYEELCDQAEDGRRTLLDHYGATNPAEFFAVATEIFFEKPGQLKRKHRGVYDVMAAYYRQDPAAWDD